jgi:hemerythrin HHE cation binding domain-containing protein
MPLAIPQVLKLDHEELHDGVARASREAGAIGAAAKRLLRVMTPHMEKEETFAHPPLGLLEDVSRGLWPSDTELGEALAMSERLRNGILDMLAEHRMITAAVEELVAAAKAQNRVEYAELALRLVHHADLEERVLYPAVAILGSYIELRFGRASSAQPSQSRTPGQAAPPASPRI